MQSTVQIRFRLTWRCVCIALLAGIVCVSSAKADAKSSATDIEKEYRADVQPLIASYCGKCHAGEKAKGEIDLAQYTTLADVRKAPVVWQKVREMLDSRQMPPKKAKRPTDAEYARLQQWVQRFLTAEAKAHAGDPGNVVLRRLSNDEYTYSIRDLTGIESLDPAREFPIDGAAGEGFTNTGVALVMSPSLVRKYLDASKAIAEHVVLLPDGIRFSPCVSRRDQTDAQLARIQAFYRQFTSDEGGSAVNLQGIRFSTNQGGRLPLAKYLTATLAERDALKSGKKTIQDVALERGLNAKYFAALWSTLTALDGAHPALLIKAIRTQWAMSSERDVPALLAQIKQAQDKLWKFNSIGHIGRQGGPPSWMEPVTPVANQQAFRIKLSQPKSGDTVTLYLVARDAGDGGAHDDVVWHNPRLEIKGGVTIPLRDVRAIGANIETAMAKALARTSEYLRAVADLQASSKPIASADLARERKLDQRLLTRWIESVSLKGSEPPKITGHFKKKIVKGRGYDAINGWGDMPSLLTNRSKDPISFLTLTVPARGVTVHPSPTQDSIIAWASPIDGRIRLHGKVADADNKCGNGAAWRVELTSRTGTSVIAKGTYDNGGSVPFKPDTDYSVQKGDVVRLIVNARDASHVCDTTHVELNISETQGNQRSWSLATDVVDQVLNNNPLPDAYGNSGVWHFCASGSKPIPTQTVPAGSTLAAWRAAVIGKKPAKEVDALALKVQGVLNSTSDAALSGADKQFRQRWTDWLGPLEWVKATADIAPEANQNAVTQSAVFGLDPKIFGQHPRGSGTVEPTSLCVSAPSIIEVKLPASLTLNAEFVVTASLHKESGADGSVQVAVLREKPSTQPAPLASPILVNSNSKASQRVGRAFDRFRQLFPPALCYARIVPVDEVVTLTLYYREDHLLRKLMLSNAQAAELDRLWEELFYVSQEPLKMVTAYEQIAEFATQDAPQMVIALKPMKKKIHDRAAAFRARLIENEPAQLQAILEFADRAWRRPLRSAEQQQLHDLYGQLRQGEIPHEEAIHLLLVRVLTSPRFLYRREEAGPGEKAVPVSNEELATRLSYFLWSSVPDEGLRASAQSGKLIDEKTLIAEARRMLTDSRTRRLAILFACQWLHIRNYDQNDEKNEKLYPQFADMRSPMYEESVRFFENLFRKNGSILDIFNADHTYLNETLAKHYSISGVNGSQWRRVDGVRKYGRGGILGMASVQASLSGASRTSPILRGNWVSETLLGERLPRPPANVPQLPDAVPSGLTARQLIERHTADPACAKCHARIDPFGFALEQYDAIGRLRSGFADTKTILFDGKKIEGIDGLRNYLMNDRRDDVVHQFCRKLLGYALGRAVQLSDEPLLAEMKTKLKANGFRFNVAVETIVLSRQFREKRGRQAESSK